MLTKKEIKKIKEQLPRGFTKLIADKAECSESLVQKFFSGARYSTVIHEAALYVANNRKEEIEKLRFKTKQL